MSARRNEEGNNTKRLEISMQFCNYFATIYCNSLNMQLFCLNTVVFHLKTYRLFSHERFNIYINYGDMIEPNGTNTKHAIEIPLMN